uniref:Uncharacterized protein n=1 Tax=Amphimedon queenslandica TaxID=400682 RepID=A0A1X7VAL9_AMPQE
MTSFKDSYGSIAPSVPQSHCSILTP